MGGRQSKRSVDITTTPKKEGIPAEGGVVGDATAPGDGKLERIEEADSKPTTNGIAPHTDLTPEDKEKDKDEATEKDKEKQPAEEVKAEETKQETTGESPVEAAEVTTPTEATPVGANAATSPDSKETKKKDKMKKKWSFRSISFNKKDKSKPAREDAPKNGDVTKEEPLAEGGEEAENATAASPTEEKSAVSSPTESENGTATAAVPATESTPTPATESTTESAPASEPAAAPASASAPAPAAAAAVAAVEAKEEPAVPVVATTEAAAPAAGSGSPTEEKKEESTPPAPSPILVEDKKEEVEKIEPEKAVEVSPAADGGDLDGDNDDDDNDDRMMKPVEGPVEVSVFRVQPVATSSIIERKTSEESQSPSQFPSSPPPTPIDPSPLQQAQQAAASATALAEALKLPAEAADEEEAALSLAQHSPSTLTSLDARTSFASTDHDDEPERERERVKESTHEPAIAFPLELPPATTTTTTSTTAAAAATATVTVAAVSSFSSFSSSSSSIVQSPSPIVIESKLAPPPPTDATGLDKFDDELLTKIDPLSAAVTSPASVSHSLTKLDETTACPLPRKNDSSVEIFIKSNTDFNRDAVRPQITESLSSNATTALLEESKSAKSIAESSTSLPIDDIKVEAACPLEEAVENAASKADPLPIAVVNERNVEEVKKLEITDDLSTSRSGNVNVEASLKNVSSASNISDAKMELVPTEINLESSIQEPELEEEAIELVVPAEDAGSAQSSEVSPQFVSIDSSTILSTQRRENASVLPEVVDHSIEIVETTESVQTEQSPSREPIIESPSSSSDVVVESEESPLSLSGEILVEAKPAFIIPEDEMAEELVDTDDSKADNTESVEVIVEPEENEGKVENELESEVSLRTEEIPVSDEADEADEASLQEDLNAISKKTSESIVQEPEECAVTAPPLPKSAAPQMIHKGEVQNDRYLIIGGAEDDMTIREPASEVSSEVIEARSTIKMQECPFPVSLCSIRSPPPEEADVVPSEDSIKSDESEKLSYPRYPADNVLTPPRSPTPESLPSIPPSTGIAATTRDTSQTLLLHDGQSNRELKTELVSHILNSYGDTEIELKERLASPADTVEESLLSSGRRRLSNDVSLGAVQEYHQSSPEVEGPVENNVAHEVSTTESVDEPPKVAPPAIPIEVPAPPPSAPAITEDVASVTKAIEEITISDKAVAAAVNETIECVNMNEIIADAHHQNNIINE